MHPMLPIDREKFAAFRPRKLSPKSLSAEIALVWAGS